MRLGSGPERFETSVAALMTWGVQTSSGIEVSDIDPGTGEQYAGVRFDDDGNPAELQEHRGFEAVFDESGAPYIGNGMTAVLRVPVGPFRKRAAVRVVYVVDEPDRVGFAYGTLHGHPESGEEAFIVEHRDDDSVWFVLRSFSRASNGLYRLGSPMLRAQQRRYTKRYLRALHPISGS